MTPSAVRIVPISREEPVKVHGAPNKREIEKTMTSKQTRPQPNIISIQGIALDIARQMPMVFLVGFIAFKLDQRNEENGRARLSEAQDNSRTILAVVQANTAVMQKVVDSDVRAEKSSLEIIRAIDRNYERLNALSKP